MKKNILITGGAGFIGSNFVVHMAQKYPDYNIINLDKLTYAANLDYCKECESLENYKFIQADICDKSKIEEIFKQYDITDVIHLAAESHVDNSISGPAEFINTNIVGTFNLIDTARNYWMKKPGLFKDEYKLSRFHHVSTDEVYGDLDDDGSLFEETTPYAPSSPYSASKASSDMIVRAYKRTYGMNITVSNCSNNYGPKQHDEKLIPVIINKCLNNQQIPVYGNGSNIRDWLYVLDHCKAIDLIFHKGIDGQTYNVGGKNERTNLQIVETICNILDEKMPKNDGSKYFDLVTFVQDRAGHDFRYAIDATKLETELGWLADESFDTGIIKTVEWYLNKK